MGRAVTTVSVPGKVMLAGEYAVLDGAPALAVTVGARLTVRVGRVGHAAPSASATIRTSLWPEPRLVHRDERKAPDEEPLVGAVRRGLELYGLDAVSVDVTSELAVASGIGSSSALRLGVLLAMATAAGESAELAAWPAARHAWLLQRGAQGRASGYDVATQLLGGLVRFRGGAPGPDVDPLVVEAWPLEAARLNENLFRNLPKLVKVFAGGRGAPTGNQMRGMSVWLDDGARRPTLTALSTELVAAFEAALAAGDMPPSACPPFRASAVVRPLQTAEARKGGNAEEDVAEAGLFGLGVARLVAATSAHRKFFASSPGFPAAPFEALARVPGFDQTFSAKTTGAGGEDALLLVGHVPEAAEAALASLGWQPLEAAFERRGALFTEGAPAGGGGGSTVLGALGEELW